MAMDEARLPGPGRILAEGWRFTWRNGGRLVTTGGFYAVVVAAIWIADDIWELPEFIAALTTAYAFASFSWEWHRAYLLGPESLPRSLPTGKAGDRDAARALLKFRSRFAWYAIALSIMVGLVVLALTMPFFLTAKMSEAVMLAFLVAVAVPTCLVLLFPLSRLGPIFAALAIQQRLGWGASWRLSRGAGWRLATALIAIGLVWLAVVVALGEVLPFADLGWPYEQVAFDIACAVLTVPAIAVASACNACVFRALQQRGTAGASAAHAFD
jgi:hypothetical protein